MKRILLMAIVAVSLGCSGAPETSDGTPTETAAKTVAPKDALSILHAWVRSDDVPEQLALLLGEDPRIERLWRDGEFYRAVVVDPAGQAADGEGDAVLVTLRADGDSWKVAIAEAGQASTLWPGL